MRTTTLALFFALLLALAGCDNSGPLDPATEGGSRLYVCNQDDATVTVISTQTNAVVETVDLTAHGFSAGAKPHHVVVEPGGAFWYVSLIGADRVAKFDRANRLVGSAPFEAPGMLALHPTENLLYAGHTMSVVDVPQTVAVIRRSDMALVETVSVPLARPHGLAVRPAGDVAYTGSLSENRLAAIAAGTNAVTLADVGGAPQVYVHFAIAPDGGAMYVTGQASGQVQIFDLSDPVQPAPAGSIGVGAAPWHPALSADGRRLYVPNKADNSVSVIDTEARVVETTIRGRGLAQPHGSALSPDGRFLYVSNNNTEGAYTPSDLASGVGTVAVIRTATLEIEAVIEVGRNPTGIGTP